MPVKYTVNNVPAGQNVQGFMPAPAVEPLSSSRGKIARRITGHPGDMPVGSPKPSATPDGPLMRSAQPSYNSPDVFFPSVYYISIEGRSIAGVTYLDSTHELPVPATAVNSIPMIGMSPAKVGGYATVNWPPATPAWQSITTGS